MEPVKGHQSGDLSRDALPCDDPACCKGTVGRLITQTGTTKAILLTRSCDDLLVTLCKLMRKWGIFFSGAEAFNEADVPKNVAEVLSAAPWLKKFTERQQSDVMTIGSGFLFFDTYEGMMEVYNLTVGDDGPTELNSYQGPRAIYAMTCSPDGEIQTENT